MAPEWPEAVSDGLSLSCGICLHTPMFDYHVDDAFWRRVVPPEHRLGVVCLPCLDRLASERGMRTGPHMRQVQFTGWRCTVVLEPSLVHSYAPKEAS